MLICKTKNNIIAQYALESSNSPIGISEYELSKFIPDNFKSSLPTIQEIEENLDALIEKENLIRQLANNLHQDLLSMDMEEAEELNDGKKLSRDAMSMSRFMVKRLSETGWIEFEYGVDTSFKEYIALAPYSIKIINTL